MKLVRLTGASGKALLVNPHHIRYINEAEENGRKISCIHMYGTFIDVLESFDEIEQKVCKDDGKGF